MSTRYLLTFCTALVLGWALITGWMNALGRVVVENPPVAEFVAEGEKHDCAGCRWPGQRATALM